MADLLSERLNILWCSVWFKCSYDVRWSRPQDIDRVTLGQGMRRHLYQCD